MLFSVRKKDDDIVIASNKEKKIALLRMFVKDVRKVAAKSCYGIPKEQQVSLDIFNKPILSLNGTSIVAKSKEHQVIYSEIKSRRETDSEIPYRGYLINVKWFSLKEQYCNTLVIKKIDEFSFGLHSCDGKLYNTSGKRVAYVITLGGNLIIHDHIVCDRSKGQTYFHSTLAAGMPVICAGLIRVDNGMIRDISNESGHYKPGIANLYNAVKLLDNVICLDCMIRIVSVTINSVTKESQIFYKVRMKGSFLADMEAVGEDGLTIPQRCFSLLKRCDDNYQKIVNNALIKNNTGCMDNVLVNVSVRIHVLITVYVAMIIIL
ncbi:hypothetical protein [Ehrlichia canis]|uniref:Uncharacterized protein n=1 Tax=Ehrlichia canis (strain Jake) TaxID=269484 RepID=A0ACA6AVS1_EHRCJ|nr:hypothetical protein [Ehrlichia canis]AAZ68442.1 hypothetical protein Ecaj_0399 [Ehrlichia canis str. Jake]AUO54806.1 hypothetical protein C1I72_02815 [Ehrlichia canis]UKC53315.1 hypothetical protein s20019040002_000358 [Ehrlichia canis]UKC54252.1 hypothetical protein s20026770001_000358 [Ehrlichia canis]UKC55188.1 hypothetical protein s21009500007_000358 [Ehrlichia canis]